MKLDCIVVGVDGSPDAESALGWAANLAAASGAQLIGVHARGLLDRDREGALTPSVSASATGDKRAHESWRRITTAVPLAGDLVIRDGDPTSVLLATADDEGADLVVVGRRGVGGTRALLGSTSHQVAQAATCPVVVVPSGRLSQ